MTRFVRDALLNGEDSTSIVILIETEFPQMRSKVTKVWVEEVGKISRGAWRKCKCIFGFIGKLVVYLLLFRDGL